MWPLLLEHPAHLMAMPARTTFVMEQAHVRTRPTAPLATTDFSAMEQTRAVAQLVASMLVIRAPELTATAIVKNHAKKPETAAQQTILTAQAAMTVLPAQRLTCVRAACAMARLLTAFVTTSISARMMPACRVAAQTLMAVSTATTWFLAMMVMRAQRMTNAKWALVQTATQKIAMMG